MEMDASLKEYQAALDAQFEERKARKRKILRLKWKL